MAEQLPDGRPSGLRRGFAALGVRNYRLYWSGQVVSLIGTWMQQVSLPWLVLALGGTPIQLGLVAVLQFGPSLALAPFGGVLADRIDKRKALIGTQIAACGQALVLFLLTATGVVQIPMVYAMAFVIGVINAVDMPVRQALSAELVPRHLLANAIALNSMAFNSARVVGPAVAGVIIALGAALTGSDIAGVAMNLGINTVTYAGVLTALLRMNPREIRRPRQPDRHPPVLHSLAEGIRYAVRTPLVLWCLVLLGGIAAFGFNFQILLPLFSTEVLGPRRRRLRAALRGHGRRGARGLADPGVHAAAAGDRAHARRWPRLRAAVGRAGAVARCVDRRTARAAVRLLQHADDQHDQRDGAGERNRCAPRAGHVPVRHRLRRIGATRRPLRRRGGRGMGEPRRRS